MADPDEIDSAGGYEDFVYLVEPIGSVERNDMAWYSEVGICEWDRLDDPELKLFAAAYWSGKPFREPAHSLFEYRARSARILGIM